jgi:cytochrome o ubiquinol oxidase subunit 1
MKEKGVAYQRPDHYNDIELPKNTPLGLIIGSFAFLFGFALVWYIWWLAIVSALGILATIIARSWDDDIYKIIPAEEVKRIEDERYRQLAAVEPRGFADEPLTPAPVPEV